MLDMPDETRFPQGCSGTMQANRYRLVLVLRPDNLGHFRCALLRTATSGRLRTHDLVQQIDLSAYYSALCLNWSAVATTSVPNCQLAREIQSRFAI